MGDSRSHSVSTAVIFGATVLTVGCAPVFSDLQSAKLVGSGRVEVTPHYTYVQFTDEARDAPIPPPGSGGAATKETNKVQDEFGLQVATGIHDRIDLRARYVYVEGVNVVGVGPKVGLLKDKIAVYLPVGFAFGGEVDSGKSWEFHPTLLLTAPINRNVELNASAKALVPFSDGDTTLAFNFGAGFGNLDRWAIRPEVGFLVDPGESGHYTQFSVGLTFFGGRKRPRP